MGFGEAEDEKIMILFNITPVAKPRMVRSDAWAGRKSVAEYWAYKDRLNLLAKQKRYKIGDTLDILFRLPMPESWSKKKKAKMNKQYHKQKPDLDNLVKGFTDALMPEDKSLCEINASKFWDLEGCIAIFNS